VLATQALAWAGWFDASQARQIATRGSLSGAVIGGALFGARMILARACSSRLLVPVAQGKLRSLISGLVFCRGRAGRLDWLAVAGQSDSRLWIAPLERLIDDRPRIALPGHGLLSTDRMADLITTLDFLLKLLQVTGDAARQLQTFEDADARAEDMSSQGRVFEHAAELFAVLATPVRLKIVSGVGQQERNVSELLALIDTTQPNMSQHLATPYRSGGLAKRREGTQMYYHLQSERVAMLRRAVCAQVAIELGFGAEVAASDRLVTLASR